MSSKVCVTVGILTPISCLLLIMVEHYELQGWGTLPSILTKKDHSAAPGGVTLDEIKTLLTENLTPLREELQALALKVEKVALSVEKVDSVVYNLESGRSELSPPSKMQVPAPTVESVSAKSQYLGNEDPVRQIPAKNQYLYLPGRGAGPGGKRIGNAGKGKVQCHSFLTNDAQTCLSDSEAPVPADGKFKAVACLGPPSNLEQENYPLTMCGAYVHNLVDKDSPLLAEGHAHMCSFDPKVDQIISRSFQKGQWLDSRWKTMCALYEQDSDLPFLDIGANIGGWSVPMSLCLQKLASAHAKVPGKVVSIEASPINFGLLTASFQANCLVNALAFNVGCSNTTGKMELLIDKRNKGQTTFLPFVTKIGSTTGRLRRVDEKIVVPVTTLDEVYKTIPVILRKVLAMKIDIEGFEGLAFAGAADFLGEAPPCYITAELRDEWIRKTGHSTHGLMKYLQTKGYERYESHDKGKEIFDFDFRQKDLAACVQAKRKMQADSKSPGEAPV